MSRKPYHSDVSDEEWAFVASYLTLMSEDAPQREHSMREVFNGLRYLVRSGAPWRWMPNDLPPWHTVYQQTMRWLAAGVFETLVHDLRALLRMLQGKRGFAVWQGIMSDCRRRLRAAFFGLCDVNAQTIFCCFGKKSITGSSACRKSSALEDHLVSFP
jgi:transposase